METQLSEDWSNPEDKSLLKENNSNYSGYYIDAGKLILCILVCYN